jgi:hypothetical protein
MKRKKKIERERQTDERKKKMLRWIEKVEGKLGGVWSGKTQKWEIETNKGRTNPTKDWGRKTIIMSFVSFAFLGIIAQVILNYFATKLNLPTQLPDNKTL